MKRPQKINRTPTAQEFNALIDYVQSLELTVSGGMEMRRTSAGTVLMPYANQQEIQVITGVTYNETTHILTVSARKFLLTPTENQQTGTALVDVSSEITTITGADVVEIDVVTDVNYNTTTGVLKQTKNTIEVWSKETTGTDSTIDTAEECP